MPGIDFKRFSTVAELGYPASTHDRMGDHQGTLYWIDSNNVQNQIFPSAASSGANTALSNLASVAINTSLVSDTDSTDDLGSSSIYWLNTYTDRIYLTEQAAPGSPGAGKGILYPDTNGTLYYKNRDDLLFNLMAGAGGSFSNFILSDGSNNQTIDDGNTLTVTGNIAINGTVAATDTVTLNWDLTKLSSANGTLTDSDYLALYDLSGVAHQRLALADLPTITALDSTNDKFPVIDATDSRLKLIAADNFPASGSGLYASLAILADVKTTGTAGGTTTATTWHARDLNTEYSDADSIVTISSNQFTPISGTYKIHAEAAAGDASGADIHRLRLYNVTGTASVKEGLNASASSGGRGPAVLDYVFTANGTDAYRIDHYTTQAQPTSGLGLAVSDGSSEVYLVIVLEKLA